MRVWVWKGSGAGAALAPRRPSVPGPGRLGLGSAGSPLPWRWAGPSLEPSPPPTPRPPAVRETGPGGRLGGSEAALITRLGRPGARGSIVLGPDKGDKDDEKACSLTRTPRLRVGGNWKKSFPLTSALRLKSLSGPLPRERPRLGGHRPEPSAWVQPRAGGAAAGFGALGQGRGGGRRATLAGRGNGRVCLSLGAPGLLQPWGLLALLRPQCAGRTSGEIEVNVFIKPGWIFIDCREPLPAGPQRRRGQRPGVRACTGSSPPGNRPTPALLPRPVGKGPLPVSGDRPQEVCGGPPLPSP